MESSFSEKKIKYNGHLFVREHVFKHNSPLSWLSNKCQLVLTLDNTNIPLEVTSVIGFCVIRTPNCSPWETQYNKGDKFVKRVGWGRGRGMIQLDQQVSDDGTISCLLWITCDLYIRAIGHFSFCSVEFSWIFELIIGLYFECFCVNGAFDKSIEDSSFSTSLLVNTL